MKNITLPQLRSFLFFFLILFFTYQMFQIIWPYTTWEWDVDFLLTKQAIIHLDYYRVAFYSHIFSSLFILGSGAFLFSNHILRKYKKLHRVLGKTYVGLLLLIAAPSGLVMAFHANGGWMAQLSFVILSPLWWYVTYRGYQTARQKDFKAHRIWMMRSYALSLSAVTLRVMQLSLNYFFYLDPQQLYIFVSWVSWLLNLGVVEWMNYQGKQKYKAAIGFSKLS